MFKQHQFITLRYTIPLARYQVEWQFMSFSFHRYFSYTLNMIAAVAAVAKCRYHLKYHKLLLSLTDQSIKFCYLLVGFII